MELDGLFINGRIGVLMDGFGGLVEFVGFFILCFSLCYN